MACRGSLVQGESLEVQIVDWGVEVHRGGSKEDRENVEEIVEAVADAADSGKIVGFAPSAAVEMKPVTLVVVAA